MKTAAEDLGTPIKGTNLRAVSAKQIMRNVLRVGAVGGGTGGGIGGSVSLAKYVRGKLFPEVHAELSMGELKELVEYVQQLNITGLDLTNYYTNQNQTIDTPMNATSAGSLFDDEYMQFVCSICVGVGNRVYDDEGKRIRNMQNKLIKECTDLLDDRIVGEFCEGIVTMSYTDIATGFWIGRTVLQTCEKLKYC